MYSVESHQPISPGRSSSSTFSSSSKRPADYFWSSDSTKKRRTDQPVVVPDNVVQELSFKHHIPQGIVSAVLETNEPEEGILALKEFQQECFVRKRPRPTDHDDPHSIENVLSPPAGPVFGGGGSSSSFTGINKAHHNSFPSPRELLQQDHQHQSTWAAPETIEGWAQEFALAFESTTDRAELQRRCIKLLQEYSKRSDVGTRYEKLRTANQVLYRAIAQMNERLRRQTQQERQTEEATNRRYSEVRFCFSTFLFLPLFLIRLTAPTSKN
ncbi:unnamed protein product [Amoebophrya sp. A120]|nr:unnamed protein product [Amoebophrya sp. A120]|eukprot:GSA120T00002958001.1